MMLCCDHTLEQQQSVLCQSLHSRHVFLRLHPHLLVSQDSLEKQPIGYIDRLIDFKELDHVIVGAGKPEICGAGSML